MNRPIAITGATGLLGQHLRRVLHDHEVVLLSRRSVQTAPNETARYVDLDEPIDLDGLPSGTTLVHLAWSHAEQSRNLLYARRLVAAVNDSPAVDRVVVLSSASVYGARQQGEIDERTPCRPEGPYARAKLGCERHWCTYLDAATALTMLRPTTALAPGGPALATLADDALHHLMRALVKRWLLQRTSVHFVSVRDVVAAMRLVLDFETPPQRELMIVAADDSPENDSYASLQDAVRAVAGKTPLPTLWLPRIVERPLRAMSHWPVGIRRRFSSADLAAVGHSMSPALRPFIQEFLACAGPSATLSKNAKAPPI